MECLQELSVRVSVSRTIHTHRYMRATRGVQASCGTGQSDPGRREHGWFEGREGAEDRAAELERSMERYIFMRDMRARQTREWCHVTASIYRRANREERDRRGRRQSREQKQSERKRGGRSGELNK